MLAGLQRARLLPGRLGVPRLAVRAVRLRSTGSDVFLFTGCVMDAWQRSVHADTIAVLGACGLGVELPRVEGACCGALHAHAGLTESARRRARAVMKSFPGDQPILVNSAGCGALLKDYGHLLGTPEAHQFANRVLDVHEVVAEHIDRLGPLVRRSSISVAVQDPCHLRHVQRLQDPVRTVLRILGPVVELDDDGLCCGAGGAYSVVEPQLARAIRDRKVGSIVRSGASIVASANPGCAMHLSAAGLDVRHPMELLATALGGVEHGR
jgi:glycolate oxidase iron-sulfur subunit